MVNQQLDPCPFVCISRPTVKVGPAIEKGDVALAWVECEACGSRGPSVSSEVSEEEARFLAVTIWNRRKDHHGYIIDNEAGDDDPAGWS